MSNPSDFVIENGVLKKYTGPGGDVVIPEGVTSIGGRAFEGCWSLTSVTIPAGVKSIGDRAFSNCWGLRNVTIVEGVGSIGSFAFSSCGKLIGMVIPEGVDKIGERAFISCDNLEEISLPESLSVLGEGAFLDCRNIKEATLPNHFIKSTKKLPAELSNAARKMDTEQLAWIFLAQAAKSWREDALTAAADKDKKQIFAQMLAIMRGQKKLGTAVATNALETCKAFRAELPAEMIKDYIALLEEKQCEKQLSAIRTDPDFQTLSSASLDQSQTRAEKLVSDILAEKRLDPGKLLDALKDSMGLSGKELPSLLSCEQKECAPCVLAWLLSAYDLNSGELTVPPDAAEVIGLLDQKSWQDALIHVATLASKFDGSSKKTNLLYPVSLYAAESTMDALTRQAYKWGRRSQEVFHEACCISDTHAAMLFAERHKTLERYACLRGTDADTLRDTVLADFGLNDDGTKRIDLGNGTVTIKLRNDLRLDLFDDLTGKPIKTIPKKNADPEKYEAAKEALALMRKNIKNAAKRRCDRLFEDFLSGSETPAEKWASVYLENPVLNRVARLLVWEQENTAFTLTENGAVDSAGKTYTLTDARITLMHPMEQSLAEVRAWQKYFTSHVLRQPFLQIWEPVVDPQEIRPDRYQGAVFSVYRFTGKEKHGIKSFDLYDYSTSFGFTLDGCRLEYTRSVERFRRGVTDDACYKLGLFSFPRYTRTVNHIVSLLDKWTAEDRIKKDDVSVANLLDLATFAQIMGFIKIAQEAKAVNVLALLLDYKNAHFADFDPMDEFTLE